MKKISIILTTLALLVTLTQCKKEEQPTSGSENNAVAITLDIKGNNGTRMDVNTCTGEVTYEEGDVIYVASSGHYIGMLTHNGTNFSGVISNPTVGEPLHFYFLGNVEPTFNTDNTECTVVISDQTEHLPVIEYAPSNETYAPSTTTYTSHLLNKCALVKFNVTTLSEAAICITGINNMITVDFGENTVTPSQEGNGLIKLSAGSGEKWAILLPQEAVEEGSAYSEDGAYSGTCAAIPAIYENGYLATGIEVNVITEINPGDIPVGAINGKFTVDANGNQVYFSQGNLQYIGSSATPYWKFAENQWDYLGTNTGQNSSDQYVDRDLFGWGTSGWNNGNIYYQPYDTESFWDNQVGNGYGPTDGTNYNYSLTDTYANADWGVYNAISNGGNVPNLWRTLTSSEWNYVFNKRTTPSSIRYAKGSVNGVDGIILLPDDWNASIYTLNYTNNSQAPYTTNTITPSDWETMEANGAVFLPAAGYRNGTSINFAGSYGRYWSALSTPSGSAYNVYFTSSYFPDYNNNYRYFGHSVRLVRNVE